MFNAGAELRRPGACSAALRRATRKRQPHERPEDLRDTAFELGGQRREVAEAHGHFERRGPGRDGPFGPPPGQNPASGFPAPGSHLRVNGGRSVGKARGD